MKGIIASIQGYNKTTTQELARKAINNGIVGIRTDKAIKVKVPIIGLRKFPGKEFYITTDKDSMCEISKWANYVAVDSRRGNRELEWLYAHAHTSNIKLVADIEKIEDVEYILKMCNKMKIIKPSYFATTFSKCNTNLIIDIDMITNIPIIAEGGYNSIESLTDAKRNGAVSVCIGAALDIGVISNMYKRIWEELC
jgi:putative N-acetylmannosamine-6-phosphate epimerase